MTASLPREFAAPRAVLKDARTGREVWKVSPDGVCSIASYMYVNSFTEDERFLFYASKRAGAWQYYRYEIETGLTTQLTDEPGLPGLGPGVNPVTQELFYRSGKKWRAIRLETLERRLVFDGEGVEWVREPAQLITFSKSGKYFSQGCVAENGCGVAVRIRCDGSGAEPVFTRPYEQMQHVMFANADDDLMSFAPTPDHQKEWNGDDYRRARVYLLNAATGEHEQFLTMTPPCTATHEYWSPNGDRLYYHKKTQPTWMPTWISVLDRRTRQHRDLYHSDAHRLGHSHVNRAETHIVTDSQDPGRNLLILIEIATGKDEILCWPDSSIKEQESHVHPAFSPSGRYVLYTSDVTGVPQVYIFPRW